MVYSTEDFAVFITDASWKYKISKCEVGAL